MVWHDVARATVIWQSLFCFFFGGIWFDVLKYAVEVDSERILFVTLPPETDKNERDEL